jgi:hypothetical protein
MNGVAEDTSCKHGLVMKLYVAGNNPYSLRALENLEILQAELDCEAAVEIIDVMQSPEIALTEGIFATPALVIRIGGASMLFVGNLSQRQDILDAVRRKSG